MRVHTCILEQLAKMAYFSTILLKCVERTDEGKPNHPNLKVNEHGLIIFILKTRI